MIFKQIVYRLTSFVVTLVVTLSMELDCFLRSTGTPSVCDVTLYHIVLLISDNHSQPHDTMMYFIIPYAIII